MRRAIRGLALLLVLPAAGCVFAVGADHEENEGLRDRVRALEHRIERLEGGPMEYEGRPRRAVALPAGERRPAPPPGRRPADGGGGSPTPPVPPTPPDAPR